VDEKKIEKIRGHPLKGWCPKIFSLSLKHFLINLKLEPGPPQAENSARLSVGLKQVQSAFLPLR
jgi:hypothetical protein